MLTPRFRAREVIRSITVCTSIMGRLLSLGNAVNSFYTFRDFLSTVVKIFQKRADFRTFRKFEIPLRSLAAIPPLAMGEGGEEGKRGVRSGGERARRRSLCPLRFPQARRSAVFRSGQEWSGVVSGVQEKKQKWKMTEPGSLP